MTLNPRKTYVGLDADGTATELPGGDAFWALSRAELERHGARWLVAEFGFDADWPTWEMHPAGDEYVLLLAGEVDLLLEEASGVRTVELREGAAVVVPRGVWHTARVRAPSRMLHVTLGAGTLTRPA
jgi:quercetin dioxygenase-like cupin family protein